MGRDKKIADSVLDLVGGTPLVRLNRVVQPGSAEVLGKVESMNPAGSVKDRIALNMIEAAEAEGRLKPGDTTRLSRTIGVPPMRSSAVSAIFLLSLLIVSS